MQHPLRWDIVRLVTRLADFELLRFVSLAAVRFTAALPWRNFDKLDAELAEISDPTNPRYGQWMTQQQVVELTGSDPSIRAEVREFLAKYDAECVDFPHALKCEAPAASVEAMLNTKITTFKQTTRKDRLVVSSMDALCTATAEIMQLSRSHCCPCPCLTLAPPPSLFSSPQHRVHPRENYQYPEELVGKALFLSNLADFPTVNRRNGRVAAWDARGQATDYTVILETIKDFYNIGDLKGNALISTAPAEFQNDTSYNKKDLSVFATGVGVADWKINKTVGPYDGASPDAEASLDTQYIGAVAYGGTQWYWTEEDWQLEFVQGLAKLPDSGVPNVFSVSWGWSEADQCTIDPAGPCASNPKASATYVQQTNQGYAAATARGISILVSSGDSGAHGRTDPTCTKKKTLPDWPTACPYITSVGATQIEAGTSTNPTTPWCKAPPAGLPACATGGSEIVCSVATQALIVSGGGFSNVAAQPAWQSAAVAAYLKSGALLPPAGDFNATSRGYPDVAALGHNYIIELQGSPIQVDGTSCSAPVFGGIIGIANGARVAAGKKVLGFLNTALYQVAAANPKIFQDITKGDNTCTENGCVTGCTGFGAVAGWDATTGLGTPNVQELVTALVALP